jgi:hypothetical protein
MAIIRGRKNVDRITESPVISLDMLGTSLVIVNNRDAANDVFWKRSTLYSDRYVLDRLAWRSYVVKPYEAPVSLCLTILLATLGEN